jgi:hypothetical protein
MRKFNLQSPFPSLRPFSENLEDERRAIDDLGVPRFFEIALLHRAEAGVHDNDVRLKTPRFRRDFRDLAAADQCGGCRPGQRHDAFRQHFQADGGGQAHGFGQAFFRIARQMFVPFGLDMYDDGRGRSARVGRRRAQAVSSVAVSAS